MPVIVIVIVVFRSSLPDVNTSNHHQLPRSVLSAQLPLATHLLLLLLTMWIALRLLLAYLLGGVTFIPLVVVVGWGESKLLHRESIN